MVSPNAREDYDSAGSSGTGLNGLVYRSKTNGKTIVVLSTSIVMDANSGWEDTQEIDILEDRVYWPCQ